METHTLSVPGARLYYETRGRGPLLLMISGGPADADVFGGLAQALEDRYMVVTFDTRGHSRSPVEDEAVEQPVAVEAEDASRLLAALGSSPAYVFGNSGGASAGLELLIRHPEQIQKLVAHEPPITGFMPDAEQRLAGARDVFDTYQREGTWPGMMRFLRYAGIEPLPQPGQTATQATAAEPTPEQQAGMARMRHNVEHFLARRLLPNASYTPDVNKLRSLNGKLVIGVGMTSQGQFANRAARVLAEKISTQVVEFPRDHGGFTSDPRGFGEVLDRVLRT